MPEQVLVWTGPELITRFELETLGGVPTLFTLFIYASILHVYFCDRGYFYLFILDTEERPLCNFYGWLLGFAIGFGSQISVRPQYLSTIN